MLPIAGNLDSGLFDWAFNPEFFGIGTSRGVDCGWKLCEGILPCAPVSRAGGPRVDEKSGPAGDPATDLLRRLIHLQAADVISEHFPRIRDRFVDCISTRDFCRQAAVEATVKSPVRDPPAFSTFSIGFFEFDPISDLPTSGTPQKITTGRSDSWSRTTFRCLREFLSENGSTLGPEFSAV